MNNARISLPSLGLLLLLSVLTGCSEEKPAPTDYLLNRIHGATRLVLDTGMSTQKVFVGDTLREFMEAFQRDTFKPGPRNVRLLSDCHPGSIVISGRSYSFAWCSTGTLQKHSVMEISLDSEMVRLVRDDGEEEEGEE